MFPFGEEVTIERYATDLRGKRTLATEFTVAGCGFAPGGTASVRASREDNSRATVVQSDAVLYAPHGSDITALDVVKRGDGTRWEVSGDPSTWASPFTGWQAGVEVRLNRYAG